MRIVVETTRSGEVSEVAMVKVNCTLLDLAYAYILAGAGNKEWTNIGLICGVQEASVPPVDPAEIAQRPTCSSAKPRAGSIALARQLGLGRGLAPRLLTISYRPAGLYRISRAAKASTNFRLTIKFSINQSIYFGLLIL
jgi:hypothetical protein